jgi:hypothetical protein
MLPTNEEIQNLISTGDVFRYAVVGISAIELALEELISESLLTSHRVELTKLTIELKVDLSIGLGLLSRDSKGLLIKLSKIRNYYAHEFKTGTDYCPHEELKSCFSKVHRSIVGDYYAKADNFKETLRISFIAAYYELTNSIERQQAKRKHRDEALLHIEAVLEATKPEPNEIFRSDGFLRAYERLDKVVEEKKKEILLRKGEKLNGQPE